MDEGGVTERWDSRKGEMVQRPDVDAFLADIEAVCRKHGLSIGHEDGHGSFIVGPFDQGEVEWLLGAQVVGA